MPIFLKNYIYIPLGGNRTTLARQSLNLLIVLVLGVIWHGSSLTFLIWGLYHGTLLALNHALKQTLSKLDLPFEALRNFLSHFKILITFFLVCIGWVIFRAHDIPHAFELLSSIFILKSQGNMVCFTTKWQYIALLLGFFPAFILPETQILYKNLFSQEARERRIAKRLMPIVGTISGVLLALSILLLNKPQQFLYSGF